MLADGSEPRNLTHHPSLDNSPAWSPDGGRVAFESNRDGDLEIYVIHPDGTGLIQMTSDSAYDGAPAWAPDGRRLAFTSDRGGVAGIYVLNLTDGTTIDLSPGAGPDSWPAWSSDGKSIAFTGERDGHRSLYLMDASGGNVRPIFADSTFEALVPAWGPGDSLIAFMGAYTQWDIWLARPDGSGLMQLTNDHSIDMLPTWVH
jgi:TolB protein